MGTDALKREFSTGGLYSMGIIAIKAHRRTQTALEGKLPYRTMGRATGPL